jgi:peptidyl-prolyl cis-trans isomerase B (cyclophilin B)
MQQVKMQTNLGIIVITLNSEKAPETVKNFLNYVNTGFYNGTIFHRVIKGFMIQGGGMEKGMREKKTNPPIKNEANNGLANKTGTIAMARTPDPHSASSQFFINVADNNFLNYQAATSQGWGYCVFGEVTEGMEIVEQIQRVATTTHGRHQDVPQKDVVIERIEAITPLP